jgi:hypothetical protein
VVLVVIRSKTTQFTPQFPSPFLKIITRSDFENIPELDKSFTPDLPCFALVPALPPDWQFVSIMETPLPTSLVMDTVPSIGALKGTCFCRTPHLTGSPCVDVFSNDKQISIHQVHSTFWMKPVDGSSITIREPSVHEYPNFLVRSVSGRTMVSIVSVSLHYHTIKVGYNFVTA